MKKAIILLASVQGLENIQLKDEYDTVVCADAGYLLAPSLGLKVSQVIGDFDTAPVPDNEAVEVLPMIKDFTDSDAAMDLVYSAGCRDITIVGGLGGRFDHTMGNIGLMSRYTKMGAKVTLFDGVNKVTMINPGSYTFRKDGYKYLGVISYCTASTGLTLEGFKYPLTDRTLTDDTSLGVSNEILGEEAQITFETGQLLIIQSN